MWSKHAEDTRNIHCPICAHLTVFEQPIPDVQAEPVECEEWLCTICGAAGHGYSRVPRRAPV